MEKRRKPTRLCPGALLVLSLLVFSPTQTMAGVGMGGGGGSCCDCWTRTRAYVCVFEGDNQQCWYEVFMDWLWCAVGGTPPDPGDPVPPPPPPGGGGGGGNPLSDPRDESEEAREESAMCVNENVLVIAHCNVSYPTFECCFLNSNDGHLCTTCNCAGCCETYWDCDDPLGQSLCRACKSDCYIGFSSGDAQGTNDAQECGLEGTYHDGELADS